MKGFLALSLWPSRWRPASRPRRRRPPKPAARAATAIAADLPGPSMIWEQLRGKGVLLRAIGVPIPIVILLFFFFHMPVFAQDVKNEGFGLRCSDWKKVGDHEWTRAGIAKEGNVTLNLKGRTVKDTAETKILDMKCAK